MISWRCTLCEPTVERVARCAPGESYLASYYAFLSRVRGKAYEDQLAFMMISSFMQTVCSLVIGRIEMDKKLMLMTFVDRYKMAAQWFGLPKLFPKSECMGLQIVRNDPTLIQWKYQQVGQSPFLLSPPSVRWIQAAGVADEVETENSAGISTGRRRPPNRMLSSRWFWTKRRKIQISLWFSTTRLVDSFSTLGLSSVTRGLK